jgi:hypothetical protein
MLLFSGRDFFNALSSFDALTAIRLAFASGVPLPGIARQVQAQEPQRRKI